MCKTKLLIFKQTTSRGYEGRWVYFYLTKKNYSENGYN